MNAPVAKKLKIFIYRPKPAKQTIWANWLFKCEPLEVEYLYTVLKENADMVLMDGQVKRYNLVREVARARPDVLLMTAMVTDVNTVLNLARAVKQTKQAPLIFVGGPDAEVMPQHFFSPDIDGVFYNNQLVAIQRVIEALRTGKPYRDVPGAAFPIDGLFRINRAEEVDYEHFPLPERPLLAANKGKYNLFYFKDCASLKSSFGCPEKCTFCFCRKMNRTEYDRRPLEAVLDEIESIPNENIFIVDDNFLLSPTRLKAFCEGVRARGLRKKFIVYGTARFIAEHPDLMRELKNAGLSAILVGMEFISDADLSSVKKGSDLADNETCIAVCWDLDIELIGLFMLNPDWPEAEFRKMGEYVRKRPIYLATFATLTTLPGTDLWESGQLPDPPVEYLWRFDFLRLHQKPKYISRLGYYRRMLGLYSKLIIRPDSFAYFRRRAGVRETLRMFLDGFISIFDFFIKVIIWP